MLCNNLLLFEFSSRNLKFHLSGRLSKIVSRLPQFNLSLWWHIWSPMWVSALMTRRLNLTIPNDSYDVLECHALQVLVRLNFIYYNIKMHCLWWWVEKQVTILTDIVIKNREALRLLKIGNRSLVYSRNYLLQALNSIEFYEKINW